MREEHDMEIRLQNKSSWNYDKNGEEGEIGDSEERDEENRETDVLEPK